ncbi:MAG: hypothetical protein JJT76_16520 [Clostridiaceae bacterium]|nr:hypothetical protein [Clostridiaceae bacterium]
MFKVYKSVDVTLGLEKQLILQKQDIPQKTHNPLTKNADVLQHQENPIEAAKEEAEELLGNAKKEAEAILQKSQQEAESIIAEAYEDSKVILENAREEGYSEGIQLGKQEGYNTFQSMMDEAQTLKKETLKTKKDLAISLEQDIVDLVMDCIKKIINHEIKENKELLLNLIEKGLEKCTFTETLIIRVSEEDYEFVDSYKSRVYMMTEGIDELSVKSDAALKRGSVIIETLSGRIDSGIQTQINQIEVLFKDLLKGEISNDSNIA